MKNERISYFDNLKFALIFLVVFGHFCEISATTSQYGYPIKFFIYIFHMPLFIFTSFLFNDKYNKSKLINRAIGFFIIYVLLKIISVAYCSIFRDSCSFDLFYESGIPWFMFAMAIWTLLTYFTRNIDPKMLLIFSILVSLVAGFFDFINARFVLSRIIVFWTYCIIADIVKKDNIIKFASKKKVKPICICLLVIIFMMVIVNYEKIVSVNNLLSGQNPYSTLGESYKYGVLFRLLLYFVTIIISILFMGAISLKKFFLTIYGQRTLAIYFLNMLVYCFTVDFFPALRIWQYFILSFLIIVLTGNKYVSCFLNRIIKKQYINII